MNLVKWQQFCLCVILSCFIKSSSSLKLLNKKVESLKQQVNFVEVSETLDFFIDHILNEFTKEDGIAYDQLRNSTLYHNNLHFIKRALLQIDLSSVPDVEARKVFFINLFNILAIDSILSLAALPSSLDNKFEQTFGYQIGNYSLTLAGIKHGILRNNSPDPVDDTVYLKKENNLSVPKDPRVIFALFTGFRQGLFTFQSYKKTTLDTALNDVTIKSCNRGVTLLDDTKIQIDEVFRIYRADFASSEEGLLRWLSKCVDDNTKKIALYYASIDQSILNYSFLKVKPNLKPIMLPVSEDKVNVDIYTESLCTEVHDFFLQQLEPTWKASASLLNINIIPFGKGSVTPISDGEAFKFECQNGPLECRGNKVQSCIIAYLPVDLQLKILTCSMANPELLDGEQECFKKSDLPFAAIRECSESLEGSQLLYENGLKTLNLKPKLFFVPTVTINGFYDSSMLRDVIKRFPEVICEKFVESNKQREITTPQGCKMKLEVYIEALNPTVQKFFIEQLVPTWKRVRNSIDLKIIPFGNTTIQEIASEVPTNIAIKCPRGPIECYGNTVMSCIVELLPVVQQIGMFECMFSKKMIPFKGEECALSEGINWQPINACAEGTLGIKLIKENENKTTSLTPPLISVPTIAVNKIHNATFSDWALHDLLALVCDSFIISNEQKTKITFPKGCPVRVEIYFELLCPDTHRFFLKVFYPAWKKISNLIDLHLIPFGKANVWLNDEGTDYEFECHNGPLECQANKVYSCVIEYLPVSLQVEFLACMLKDRNAPQSAGQTCAEKLNVAWAPLSECSNLKEGSNLLFQNGLRTLNLKPTLFFVPSIVINGFYDADSLEKSLIKFGDQICEAYVGEFYHSEQTLTPKGCRLQVQVFFSISSKSSRNFILNHLIPAWQILGGDNLSINLISLGSDSTAMEYFDAKHCHENIKCSMDLLFVCVSNIYIVESQLDFLQCMFNSNTTLDSAKKCSRAVGISWDKIANCFRETSILMKLNNNIKEAKNLRPKFHYFPTVTLNGFYNKIVLKKSMDDFMDQICNSFYDPSGLTNKIWKPRGCPVTVDLYLESLCPDTKWIFLQQVAPSWNKLSSIMNLKIIPFGKASAKLLNPDKDEYTFKCQNGPLECHGNKVMSCIAHHYPTASQILILECMLNKQFPAVEGRECAEQLGLPWGEVLNCIEKEGSKLLYENGIKTEKVRPKIFFIPTVALNGYYDKTLLRQAFKDLPGLICEEYLKDDGFGTSEIQIPHGCKVSVTVYFENLDESFKLFFSSEAEEIWKIYRKIINLHFAPIHSPLELYNSSEILTVKNPTEKDNYLLNLLSCLDQTQNTDVQMEYLACLMTLVDIKDRIQKCSDELKLNLKELDVCATSKGYSFVNTNQEQFKSYHKNNTTLPLIVVNKIIIKEQKQLRKVICRLFRGPKIPECGVLFNL